MKDEKRTRKGRTSNIQRPTSSFRTRHRAFAPPLEVGRLAVFPLAFAGATWVNIRRFSLHTHMNKSIITLVVTAALAAFAQAESTVKLTDVHICCKSCVKGIDKAVGT